MSREAKSELENLLTDLQERNLSPAEMSLLKQMISRKRYQQSSKGKAARKRYQESKKGKAARARHQASDSYKEYQKKYHAKRYQAQRELADQLRDQGVYNELLGIADKLASES